MGKPKDMQIVCNARSVWFIGSSQGRLTQVCQRAFWANTNTIATPLVCRIADLEMSERTLTGNLDEMTSMNQKLQVDVDTASARIKESDSQLQVCSGNQDR